MDLRDSYLVFKDNTILFLVFLCLFKEKFKGFIMVFEENLLKDVMEFVNILNAARSEKESFLQMMTYLVPIR